MIVNQLLSLPLSLSLSLSLSWSSLLGQRIHILICDAGETSSGTSSSSSSTGPGLTRGATLCQSDTGLHQGYRVCTSRATPELRDPRTSEHILTREHQTHKHQTHNHAALAGVSTTVWSLLNCVCCLLVTHTPINNTHSLSQEEGLRHHCEL